MRLLGRARPSPKSKNVCADGLGQELVQDHPLVVPAHDPLGLGEDLLDGEDGAEVGLDVGDDPVVEAEHREVQLADDEVLVVAGVADEGDVLGVARQVGPGPSERHGIGPGDGLDEEARGAAVDRVVVEEGADPGAAAVDAVEVERRDAEVADRLRVLAPGERARRVERHVVVEELAEEGHARGQVGVVGVVRALRRVDDERDGVGAVLRVHDPAGLAELHEGAADGGGVGGEGRQGGEQTAEPALLVERRLRREDAGIC
ncbi:hypothetical protein GCM10009721_25600 [Terrabacter tumescens]|uniref:Uncharacterized protein n=1 Tax=Terrabacter tumescens TaxID=60443 RepID=A0ABQ2I4L9_9MICO|nr:hypothetical protein [Terrabacter tumescens]GGM97505.1 hypothetical protein GCM10009721_25600 [Terrabacter tumescens]